MYDACGSQVLGFGTITHTHPFFLPQTPSYILLVVKNQFNAYHTSQVQNKPSQKIVIIWY
jgi:hypothetical protein